MSLIPPPVSHTLIDTVAWGIPITNTVNALAGPRIYPVNRGALTQASGWGTPAGGTMIPVTPTVARRWLILFSLTVTATSPANTVGYVQVTVNGGAGGIGTLNFPNPSTTVTYLNYFAGAINTIKIEYTSVQMAASTVFYLDGGAV